MAYSRPDQERVIGEGIQDSEVLNESYIRRLPNQISLLAGGMAYSRPDQESVIGEGIQDLEVLNESYIRHLPNQISLLAGK
jgi:hypothetical protein